MKYLGSEHFSLSKWDLDKIAKGAAIAGLASACTWLLDQAIPWLKTQPEINLTLVTVLSAVINAVRKWATDTTVTMFVWVLALCVVLPGLPCQAQDVELIRRQSRLSKPVPAKIVVVERQGPLRRAALGRFRIHVVPKNYERK